MNIIFPLYGRLESWIALRLFHAFKMHGDDLVTAHYGDSSSQLMETHRVPHIHLQRNREERTSSWVPSTRTGPGAYAAWAGRLQNDMLRFHVPAISNQIERILAESSFDAAILWNGYLDIHLDLWRQALRNHKIPTVFLERGPVRGTFDSFMLGLRGVNADADFCFPNLKCCVPATKTVEDVLRALQGPAPKPDYLIFPLQVHDDTQLFLYGKDLEEAVEDVADLETDLPILVKPHPVDKGRYEHTVLESFFSENMSWTNTPLPQLLENAAGLITINSSAGFEALARGVPVFLLGQSFYDDWLGTYPITAVKDRAGEYIDQETNIRRVVEHLICFEGSVSPLQISSETYCRLTTAIRAVLGKTEHTLYKDIEKQVREDRALSKNILDPDWTCDLG